MGKICLSLLLLCCCCASLNAEQVTLKNGDRITGALVSFDPKPLPVKTEYAGVFTIDWDSVAQFTSAQPMVVTRTDSQTISGPVTAQESSVLVTSPSGPQRFRRPTSRSFARPPTRQPTRSRCTPVRSRVGWVAGPSAWRWLAATPTPPTLLPVFLPTANLLTRITYSCCRSMQPEWLTPRTGDAQSRRNGRSTQSYEALVASDC